MNDLPKKLITMKNLSFKNYIRRVIELIEAKYIDYQFRNRPLVYISSKCEFQCPQNIYFDNFVNIGRGSFFSACFGKIVVGEHSSFNMNVHINASVGGEIIIGKNVLVGPNVVMRTANHKFTDSNKLIRNQGHNIGDIIIEDDVWIAAGVILLSGIKIGKGAVIGAGAVVTKDIPSMAVAVGNPAKVIKFRA